MAIKNWHVGKIILCWVAGLLMIFFVLPFLGTIAGAVFDESSVPGWLAILLWLVVWVGLLILLFVMTWKWLSGREKSEPPASQ